MGRIYLAIFFLAITGILGFTGWGFISLQTPGGSATFLHIPVLLTALLGGLPEGILAGVIFALSAWFKFPLFPLMHFPGRILAPVLAWLIYQGGKKVFAGISRAGQIFLSALLASLTGSLVNTWLTLGIGLWTAQFTISQLRHIWNSQGRAELIFGISIITPTVVVWELLRKKKKAEPGR